MHVAGAGDGARPDTTYLSVRPLRLDSAVDRLALDIDRDGDWTRGDEESGVMVVRDAGSGGGAGRWSDGWVGGSSQRLQQKTRPVRAMRRCAEKVPLTFNGGRWDAYCG
jgi:hypothetical protein